MAKIFSRAMATKRSQWCLAQRNNMSNSNQRTLQMAMNKSADMLRFDQVKKTTPPVAQGSHGRHCNVGLFDLWLGVIFDAWKSACGGKQPIPKRQWKFQTREQEGGKPIEPLLQLLCCHSGLWIQSSTSYPDQRLESHLKSLLGHHFLDHCNAAFCTVFFGKIQVLPCRYIHAVRRQEWQHIIAATSYRPPATLMMASRSHHLSLGSAPWRIRASAAWRCPSWTASANAITPTFAPACASASMTSTWPV